MTEVKPLSDYKAEIWARLEELSKRDFPQFRTCQRADGSWVEREPVPEYMERERLCRTWQEIMAYENWFNSCHNSLLISLRLAILNNRLLEHPIPMDIGLLNRIAVSVYQNTAIESV